MILPALIAMTKTQCLRVLRERLRSSDVRYEFCEQIFPTRDFPTFPDALQAVAQEEVFQSNTPSAAAFACAGPVANNKCDMTNLDWTIDGNYLSATHGIRYAP